MKCKLIALLLSTAFISQLSYTEEKDEKKLYPLQAYLPFRVSGFIKYEAFADSRQVVGARDDQILLYPEKKLLDSNCQDINAKSQFEMVAIQTRLHIDADGPTIARAKSSGTIEADFFGKAEIANIVRMRLAYLNLAWKKIALRAGQYYLPLYVEGADPRTLSFNTGIPMDTFARSPQFRLTYSPGSHVNFIAAVSSELDSPSDGPIGLSTTYLRNAVIPRLDAQVQVYSKWLLCGADIEYKRIVPRLQTNTGTKAHESLNSFIAIAYASFSWENVSTRSKIIYAQNPTDVSMTGGYAVHCVDSVNDHREYTNLNVVALWNDTEFEYHKTLCPGWFIGIVKSLGSRETILQNVTNSEGVITDQRIFGNGTDIDYVFRFSPRLQWKTKNFMFGAELEYTQAAYGTINATGDVINTTPVGNARLLLTLYYYL